MDKKTAIITQLKKFKRDLNIKIKIDKIIFFGSIVEGRSHKDSDIDLIIVSKDFKEKRFRYRPIGFYDCWNLNYPVDFLCYTPEEFNKLSKQISIVSEAIKNGIEI